MQSTGQTSTHAVSLVPMQGSQMMYATVLFILAHTCDPLLAALFTPPRPHLGRYEACVTDEPIARVRQDGWQYGPLEQLEALEAFGSAGTYDRAKLTQLYRGRRVEVLRGWRKDGDRFESVMLLSPYPDASLQTLHDGTLIIRFILDRPPS